MKYKRIIIFILQLSIFISVTKAVTPSFRFIADFQYNPFFYEPRYTMYSNALNGSIMGGVKYNKITVGIEIQNNYYSFTGHNNISNLYGAWNITRGSLLLYCKPVDWFEFKVGTGGALLLSQFNYNNTGFISYFNGGLSFLLDTSFSPPRNYISIVLINRFDLFFPNYTDSSTLNQYNNQLLLYYYGGIRLNFHPYFDWINLYVETGGMPWIYNSYPVSFKTGMFIWGAGISIDMVFPDTVIQVSKMRLVYKEKMNKTIKKQNINKDTDSIDKLETSEEGDIITFPDIIFHPDSDKIKEESFPVLDAIASLLLDRSEIEIEIIGYTNSVGAHKDELILSADRAIRVAEYLTSKGVDPYRMKTSGHGGVASKNKNIDENNRRVEIIFKKNNIN